MTLSPASELRKVLPPAVNQHGEGHQILFRLTRSRFKSMRRAAQLLEETDSTKTYSLTWVPSAKDRKTNPDLPADASVDVFLHEVELDNGETLYLVTTLTALILQTQSAATVRHISSNRPPASHFFATVRCCAVPGSHSSHNDRCDSNIARSATVTPGHGRNLYQMVRAMGDGLNCYSTDW